MLNYINSLNQSDFPQLLAEILDNDLNGTGKLNLLGVALQVNNPRYAVVLIDAYLNDVSAGYPSPHFICAMQDAKWHASIATPMERKAYTWAHFHELHINDQKSFINVIFRNGNYLK